MNETKKMAIVRVRGPVRVNDKVERTMQLLRLYRKNYCVVLEANPQMIGMIQKIKDYVTFGEIDEETYKMLIEKRGEEANKNEEGKCIVFNNKKYKPFLRLSPPRKGFGRKGIKVDFKTGGALGYRGNKINDLIQRMI